MGATDFWERVIADLCFGSTNPATWYFALSKTTPNDDGTNFTEPVGGAYARVPITNNPTSFPAATTIAGITNKTNGVKITWPNPTLDWGPMTHWGCYRTLSGGLPDFHNPLDTPIVIRAGNTPVEIDIGQLIMTFA